MILNNSNYDGQIDDEDNSWENERDDTSRIETGLNNMTVSFQIFGMKVTKVQLFVDRNLIYLSYPTRQARFWGFYYCYERPVRFSNFAREFSLYGD